ncbi:hypothetical protein BCR34DRAFT_608227 [Clohesyomyces aquaticus]|uniref:EF-hand domain-containing protein n=1 Tax=Clohesyomyces aquaticus TaxID=1231657 RepID=A0A1Y1Y9H7_9PLEO|nr:hypothetical protein BCR34DRAFT_608227 [Clohesyomyces aquaticus]
MKAIFAAAVLGSILPLALGYCCGGTGSGICGDGTTQGAGCCAYGRCNIFCCNCDPAGSTCRGGRGNFAEIAQPVDAGTEWTFNEADKSGSGSISLADYLEYMKIDTANVELNAYWVSWFNEHDTNGDGLLTLEEAA